MLDHVTANVGDFDAAKRFYAQALVPLGYSLQMEFEGGPASAREKGYPTSGSARATSAGRRTLPSTPATARPWTPSTKPRWLGAGKDNGAPGLRPHYHESYYAAYVHDPDSNNIEAVCHKPE